MGLRWRLMYNSGNTSGHISQLLGFLGESLFYEWKIQSLLLLARLIGLLPNALE